MLSGKQPGRWSPSQRDKALEQLWRNQALMGPPMIAGLKPVIESGGVDVMEFANLVCRLEDVSFEFVFLYVLGLPMP